MGVLYLHIHHFYHLVICFEIGSWKSAELGINSKEFDKFFFFQTHFLSFEILVWISLASWIFLESCISLIVKAIFFVNNYSYMFSWRKRHFDAKTITGGKKKAIFIIIFGVNFITYWSHCWRIRDFKLVSRKIGITKRISNNLLKEYLKTRS